jgi:hypothetical protein
VLNRLLALVVAISFVSAPSWAQADIFSGSSVTTPLTRTSIDQPDDIHGYQIHVVYVVPSDEVDANRDTNGDIATWLDEASSYSKEQIGLTPPYDKLTGKYDISFLKSRYSISRLSFDTSTLDLLKNELQGFDISKSKVVAFMVETKTVPSFCGFAQTPGSAFVVLVGNPCSSTYTSGIHTVHYVSTSLLHEWFHSLGVNHTCVAEDLMLGSGCSSSLLNTRDVADIDLRRINYVTSNNSGADIATLPVWLESNRDQKNYLPPKAIEFPSQLKAGGTYLYSASFADGASLNPSAACTTTLGGITLQTEIFQFGNRFSCKFTLSLSATDFNHISMQIDEESLFNYSRAVSKQLLTGTSQLPSTCTTFVCTVGQVFIPLYEFCWPNAVIASLQMEQGTDWVKVKSHWSSKLNRCPTPNPYAAYVQLKLAKPGTFKFRWVIYENQTLNKVLETGTPFTVNVGS